MVTGEINWLGDVRPDQPGSYDIIYKIKRNMTPIQLCTARSAHFIFFVKAVFSLKFDEEPPYEKLKHILREALLKKDRVPNNRFDWSKYRMIPSGNVA